MGHHRDDQKIKNNELCLRAVSMRRHMERSDVGRPVYPHVDIRSDGSGHEQAVCYTAYRSLSYSESVFATSEVFKRISKLVTTLSFWLF